MTESNATVCPCTRRAGDGAWEPPAVRERVDPTTRFGRNKNFDSKIRQVLAAADSRAADSNSWPVVKLQINLDLREVEQEWKAFETRADCTVFQTFDWLSKWQHHIGTRHDIVPAVVLGRDSHERLLFVLPLAIAPDGPIRRLTWLGSHLCDYNAPLLAARFPDHFGAGRFALLWQEIIGLLQTNPRLRFDLVDLQKMPETVGTQRNPFLALEVIANPSSAHIARLDRDWERFYALKRSSSTRKRERRQLKHLAEHGAIRFVDVQDRREIEHTVDTLISQKRRSFARMGVKDMFARPGYREFFLDIAADPNLRQLCRVSRLDVGSTAAAAGLGLKFHACYYLVLSSYDDGELSRFGPGRAHLHELLRYAIDHGFDLFDFTIGDEPYKRDWCDIEVKIYDYLAAVTIRGWAVVAITTAFRRAKRFIKRTPILWRTFTKARALAGSINPS